MTSLTASQAHQATVTNVGRISITRYVECIDIAISEAIADNKFEINNVQQLCYSLGDNNASSTTVIDKQHMDAIVNYYKQLGYNSGWYWSSIMSTTNMLTNKTRCWYICWKNDGSNK